MAAIEARAVKHQHAYEALGDIKSGVLTMFARDHMLDALRRFPDGTVVVRVEQARDKRSSRVNRYWHGVVVPLFAEHCGYEFDEAKDALALHLIPKTVVDIATGEERQVPGHTSQLTVGEFNELIRRAQQLGAEMGIYIPDPNEVDARGAHGEASTTRQD